MKPAQPQVVGRLREQVSFSIFGGKGVEVVRHLAPAYTRAERGIGEIEGLRFRIVGDIWEPGPLLMPATSVLKLWLRGLGQVAGELSPLMRTKLIHELAKLQWDVQRDMLQTIPAAVKEGS